MSIQAGLSIFSARKLDVHQFWYDQCTVRVILTSEVTLHYRNLLLIKGYIYNFYLTIG
ncbi:hypothetical protein CKO_01947 [Citrobacter koseri ATCC BAA-895]|uniref:Uncharacterized protein n=1 Tax=Citrobacter koseri (strain ATCC BAA-895 / CDC 4225-83 / SGSC4696) TaxID=290338 RepID=A8AHW1_CITK8|nr:hypothetical protein CKO_01947 [Citrobacter koseri ATCC BAA-895]